MCMARYTCVHNDHFSVEIHYDGPFCGLGKKRIYMYSKIDWFDFCNSDTWSLLYIEEILEILECKNATSARVYWCKLVRTVADGKTVQEFICNVFCQNMNIFQQNFTFQIFFFQMNQTLRS